MKYMTIRFLNVKAKSDGIIDDLNNNLDKSNSFFKCNFLKYVYFHIGAKSNNFHFYYYTPLGNDDYEIKEDHSDTFNNENIFFRMLHMELEEEIEYL